MVNYWYIYIYTIACRPRLTFVTRTVQCQIECFSDANSHIVILKATIRNTEFWSIIENTHTHTHTHIYIYIYNIYTFKVNNTQSQNNNFSSHLTNLPWFFFYFKFMWESFFILSKLKREDLSHDVRSRCVSHLYRNHLSPFHILCSTFVDKCFVNNSPHRHLTSVFSNQPLVHKPLPCSSDINLSPQH